MTNRWQTYSTVQQYADIYRSAKITSITVSHSAIIHCHRVQDTQTGKEKRNKAAIPETSFILLSPADCKVRHTHHLGMSFLFFWQRRDVRMRIKKQKRDDNVNLLIYN